MQRKNRGQWHAPVTVLLIYREFGEILPRHLFKDASHWALNEPIQNRKQERLRTNSFWLIKKGRIAATEEKDFDIMKPYGHVMSDEEIWSVVRYVWETYIDKKK